MSSDWVIGHPSDNKAFVATIVIASLLLTSFFIGTGVMLYFWMKSWRGEDAYRKHTSRGENEKGNIDLETGRAKPQDESDESPIVKTSEWRQDTIAAGASPSEPEAESESIRTSSETSSSNFNPTRPRSQDFHELYHN